MFQTLNTGAIGLGVGGVREAIVAAKLGGFAGVEVRSAEVAELVDEHGAATVRGWFEEAGVRPAAWALGIDFRGEEAAWREEVAGLGRRAAAMAAVGCTRAFQVLWSWSDTRPYAENWAFHVERLRPIAATLAEQGCRLGFEFLGPATLRAGKAHPFVYTAAGALELGAEIGPNVGLLLDSWHWYTSHGTLADLRGIRAEQIVHVHINDAPVGIAIDDQLDLVRELPGETGIIDLRGFFAFLRGIKYDGPVTVEPFKAELKELPSDAARMTVVKASLDAVWG